MAGTGRRLDRHQRRTSCVALPVQSLVIASLFSALSACQADAPITPTSPATPTVSISTPILASATATSLVAPALPTTGQPTSTPKPTALPALPATLTPGPFALTVGHAAQIEPVAVWGKGVASGLVWSPDGRELARPGGLGVDLIAVDPLALRQFVPSAFAVEALAYSPDGRYLAVAGSQVQLWDRLTLSVVATLPGVIENGVRRLSFSPGGMWLVGVGTTSGGGDPGARLIVWRVADGQIQRTWETDYCGAGADFALSPDGRQLARLVCGKLWVENTATGDVVFLPDDDADVYTTAFTPDGQTLLASTRTGGEVLRFYDLTGAAAARDLAIGNPTALSISADGATILLRGSWDESRRAWVTTILDPVSEQIRYTLTDVRDAALSPDGHRLAVVRLSDGGLDLRNVVAAEPISSLNWPPVVTHIAFSRLSDAPGTIVLATGDQQGRVALRDPESGAELFATHVFSDAVSAVALDSEARFLAAARAFNDGQAEIVVLEWATGRQITRIGLRGSWGWEVPVDALAFSRDGGAIAARTDVFGQVRAWTILDGAELEHPELLSWHQAQALGADTVGRLWSLDLVKSGAETDPDRQVLTVRSASGERIIDLPTPAWVGCGDLQRLAISGDGRYLAMGCDQPELAIWDLTDQPQLTTIAAHTGVGGDGFYGNVLDVAFAPYGPLLASAGYDGDIRLWNAETHALLAILKGHRNAVSHVAWSPDARWLASVSSDGTVRLWGVKP